MPRVGVVHRQVALAVRVDRLGTDRVEPEDALDVLRDVSYSGEGASFRGFIGQVRWVWSRIYNIFWQICPKLSLKKSSFISESLTSNEPIPV